MHYEGESCPSRVVVNNKYAGTVTYDPWLEKGKSSQSTQPWLALAHADDTRVPSTNPPVPGHLAVLKDEGLQEMQHKVNQSHCAFAPHARSLIDSGSIQFTKPIWGLG